MTPEATDLLLGLGVGTVGRQQLTGFVSNHSGRAGREQTTAEYPGTSLLDLVVEGTDLRDHTPHVFALEVDVVLVVVPHRQQILAHHYYLHFGMDRPQCGPG